MIDELGRLRVMRDEQPRDGALVTDLAHQREHVAAARRVEVARRLVGEQQTRFVDQRARDRDRFYALLRSAAQERGMALLVASEEIAALQGVGVLMSIADGELCSTEEHGTVVNLPGRRRAAGDWAGA